MECSVESCDQIKKFNNGLCHKHYQRWKRHGDPTIITQFPLLGRCKVDGCLTKDRSKGYCSMHYQRYCDFGDPGPAQAKIEQHGLKTLPEYTVWKQIKGRCNNIKSKSYADYGGRGIKMCERWERFTVFLDDMGRRPTLQHTIERVNNDLGYAPDNCKWATRVEQNNNKRSNRRFTFEGETLTIAQWSRRVNIPYHSLYKRLVTNKWPVNKALGF